jgi:hypothetical protein
METTPSISAILLFRKSTSAGLMIQGDERIYRKALTASQMLTP